MGELRGVLCQAPSWLRLVANVEEERVARRVYEQMGVAEQHAGDEAFDANTIWGYQDGDWPEWPAQDMIQWVPESVQQQFGSVVDSTLNGSYLMFDPEQEIELVAAMDELGFTCRRDDVLIEAANGG